jgi:ethanolamine utilization protein EutA
MRQGHDDSNEGTVKVIAMNTERSQIVKSVGIDIGTTTTQIVISQLTVKNTAPGTLVPRMQITDKVVVYKSEIYFTPIKDNFLIDADKLVEIVRSEYGKAGIKQEDVDTGAVIITGETAKKENAKLISQQISRFAGDFVVATAGGNLESIIAGKGSGAADYSASNYCTVANIDIGGGTSNIGIFKNGKAIDSCCINIGGRLLQISSDTGQVKEITAPMKAVLADLGIDGKAGDSMSISLLEKICGRMSEVLIECISLEKVQGLAKALLMTDALRLDYIIDVVMISGGVADYVYRDMTDRTKQELFRFGDIGPLLGQQVKNAFAKKGYRLERPSETIRATVIGAGSRTVDVSGSTILVDDSMLPLKNIPVIKPFSEDFLLDEELIANDIRKSADSFYKEDSIENFAVAIPGRKQLSFADIIRLAGGILKGLEKIIKLELPIIIVAEQDYGKVLGQTLKSLNPKICVICIDQIEANEGDYIDIGKPIAGGSVVPVIIKTLIFETKQI